MPLIPVNATERADIGVVILGFNNLYDECLTSLARAIEQTTKTVQVVILDNGSTRQPADERVGKSLPQALTIRREGNYGFSQSVNVGAGALNASYYFILNPDTRLTEEAILDKLTDYLIAHPDVGIVTPKVVNMDGTRQDTCRRFPAWYQPIVQRTLLANTSWGQKYLYSFHMKDFDQQQEKDLDWVQGSALMIPEGIWKQLKGFDEYFWLYFEDVDLCRRVHGLDKRIVYLPTVTLQHAFGRASAKSSQFIGLFKNRALRAHIVSWIKYLWKWRGQELPKRAS